MHEKRGADVGWVDARASPGQRPLCVPVLRDALGFAILTEFMYQQPPLEMTLCEGGKRQIRTLGHLPSCIVLGITDHLRTCMVLLYEV